MTEGLLYLSWLPHLLNDSKGKTKKALVVEDQMISLQVMAQVLKSLGYDYSLAFDIDEAIDELKNESFDLLIMDWFLPTGTGADIISIVDDQKLLETTLNFVTFSGSNRERLEVPQSPIFKDCGHIHKSAPLAEIVKQLNFINR